ncbi:MAG: class I SAM-dependent methyltransferase [Cyanobacteria bacterium P01_G01_bin.39]
MWNHNTHFHNYLLRQFPTKVNRSLDIGCGLGLFTRKLAKRSKTVDAVDVDGAIIKETSDHNTAPNIFYRHADFLEADLPEESYDVIVCIASLHHMDLEAALKKIKVLLCSSGKLLVLGLYREITVVDYMYSVISVLLNLVYLNWHRDTESIEITTTAVPTLPAQLSLKQIETVARTLIPGYRLQRHLFWRYSLIWQKR